jgi:hypothetical protein
MMLRTQGTTLHERLSQNGPVIADNLYSHGGQEQVSESTYGQLNGPTDMSTHITSLAYSIYVPYVLEYQKEKELQLKPACLVA